MKVECLVEIGTVTNESGREVGGVTVTCGRCTHQVTSFGTTDRSVRRCFMLLKEACPNQEVNYYDEGRRSNVVTPPPTYAAPGGSPKPHASHADRGPPITPATIPPLIAENNFAVIKTATTGLKTDSDQVIQLGIIHIDGGAPRWRMTVNLRPTVPVSEKASEKNGLTSGRLAFSPLFAEIAPTIAALVQGRVVLGYNSAAFDLPILTRQLAEAGVPLPQFQSLDVLLFERRYAKDHPEFADAPAKSHSLKDAVRRWGVPVEITWDALNDAKAIWGVFVSLCSTFPELGQTDLDGALDIQNAEQTLTGPGLRTRPGTQSQRTVRGIL